MAKKYKLSSVEARAWRTNKPQWVSPQGIVLRAVTPEEEAAIFPAIERAKKQARGGSVGVKIGKATVMAVYLRKDDFGTDVRHEVSLELTFRVTPTGREATNYVLDTFCNGNRYVKGREIIKSRLLQKHGETIVNGMNGKRLDIVRDPRLKRPSYSESQRDTPTPENCLCRGWKDRSDIHRHHPACQWNSKAPPHERALPTNVTIDQPSLLSDPEPLTDLAFGPISAPARAAVQRASAAQPFGPRAFDAAPEPVPGAPGTVNDVARHVMPGMPIQTTKAARTILKAYSPSECPDDCRGVVDPGAAWEWPAERPEEAHQHHPFCQYDASWRARHGEEKQWALYDVRLGKEVRAATRDEVAKAEVEYSRSGTRSIELGGSIYAVVPLGEPEAPRRQKPGRPAEPAPEPIGAPLPSVRQRQAEARRLEALADSGLPADGSSFDASGFDAGAEDERLSKIAYLKQQIAIMEGRAPTQAFASNAVFVATPSVVPQPVVVAPVVIPQTVVSPPAEHLRDELGLVGLQRLTDDIPAGPVVLHEPEPFVDPLAVERQARARARADAALRGAPPAPPPPPSAPPPQPPSFASGDAAPERVETVSHPSEGVTRESASGIMAAAL